MQPFHVALTVTETHGYVVDARTPEEAELLAEQLFLDGEDGAVSDTMLEVVDSYPVEDVSEPELEEEEDQAA